jgi:hypothetical protein
MKVRNMEMLKPVKALDDFLEQTPPIWNKYQEEPAPNSQAALELAEYERPESIQTAYSQASFLFEAAGEYAWAVVKTLTEPFLAIAPWACARGALESSALAMWLWDEKINVRDRAERSLAFRCEGLRKELTFARGIKEEFDPTLVSERLREAEGIATKLGFTQTKKNQKGKNEIVFNHPMPDRTKIIDEMLGNGVNYRLFSAMVHGHAWALQPLSFGKRVKPQVTFALNGIKYVVKNIEPNTIAFLCMQTLVSLSGPILAKCKLFGWESLKMKQSINTAIKEIKASYIDRT